MLEEGATIFAGVPAMIAGVLAAAEKKGVPRHSLRIALSGGAPLPLELQRRWEELFDLPLRQGYGLTEASPVCLFNRLDRPNRPGTLGFPFPGVEVSIRDASGDQLPIGEVGEICVRGDNVFLGYNDAGRSAANFFGDWLRTGDLGSAETGGAVRFRGMLKAMFTRNGFNVYPREIERVLKEDVRIAEASAYGLPSQARENDLLVMVRSAPGATLDEEAVREICRQRLAAYKQPSRVILE